MSGYTITRYVLNCDRCPASIGSAGEYGSATEARAAAYGMGWRFPARIKANGNRSSRSDDLCKVCANTLST